MSWFSRALALHLLADVEGAAPGAIFPAVDDVVPAALHARDSQTERDPTPEEASQCFISAAPLKYSKTSLFHHGGNPISLQQSHCSRLHFTDGDTEDSVGEETCSKHFKSERPDFLHPSSVLSESPIRRTCLACYFCDLGTQGTTCTPTYTVSKHGSWSHLSGSSHTPRLRG